jgi:hypothetical protein
VSNKNVPDFMELQLKKNTSDSANTRRFGVRIDPDRQEDLFLYGKIYIGRDGYRWLHLLMVLFMISLHLPRYIFNESPNGPCMS